MRGQDSQANCGPYALLNALRALGIQRTAEELESACGTTMTKGTSTAKLFKAANKIEGCSCVRINERRRDVALLKLQHALQNGRPVVIAWADGSHWVCAIGMLGPRYLIADAAENELVLSIEVEEVEKQWEDEGRYDGIIL